MAKGHIKLGAVGSTLRPYKLISENRYRRVTANPYSAKISTGGGTYDDLEPFAYWVQDDWQNGIGHKNPDEGLLFSTAETRVPNQIILPQVMKHAGNYVAPANDTTDWNNLGRRASTGTLTIGTGQTYDGLAVKVSTIAGYPSGFTLPANTQLRVSVYGKGSVGATITCTILGPGTPPSGALGTYQSMTLNVSASDFGDPYYRWLTFPLATASGTIGTSETYWIVFSCSGGTLEIVCSAAYTGATVYGKASTVYTDITSGAKHPIFSTSFWRMQDSASASLLGETARCITAFNSTLYAAIGKQLVKYTVATDLWAPVGAVRGANITDLQVWGATLHIALDAGNYDTLSTADAYTTAGVTRSLFAKWNGYLWSKWGNSLYYSANGTSWSAAIEVGHAGSTITGMAGLGDTLYVATTEALYYIAPGDVAVGVTRWGSVRATNGTSLIHHQGVLYAIVDGGVAQISVSGGSASVLPMWVNRDDDFVASYLERPLYLISCNNWLVALVQQTTAEGRSSLWAWTGQGWHYLAETPLYNADAIYYDFSTSRIWTCSRAATFFNVRVPDYTLNPTNDSGSSYVPSAWFETGWITGGLKDVEKDFESVYISGDTLNASQYVEVFFKSSRTGSWTLLGTIDAPGEELRWSTYASRPATKELKLGFRLFSKSLTATPDIDVIRLKYLPNVMDRWQWTLPIELGPRQELLDGTIQTYTVAQMTAHLDALIQSTPPFLLEDVDGVQYEVVCTGASVDLLRLDYYNAAFTPWWVYTLTLEQVHA